MNYLKIYNNLIDSRRINEADGYSENHHIIPKCLGGSDDKDNLIKLTAREHFIAHLLLTKIYPNNNKISYAFNMMLSTSDNQERYLPPSHWYEYRRKLFSENHPLKDPEIKKRHLENSRKATLKRYSGNFTKLSECKNCNSIIYGKPSRKYCSKQCIFAQRKSKLDKKCPVCGKKHRKKYCCSKECFLIYVQKPNNEYSKKLSEARSEYIKENPDKIKAAAKKGAEKADQSAKGKKISETKQKNSSGNNCATSTEIRIYNDIDELVYYSPRNESFRHLCEENDLPYHKFCYSYKNQTKLKGEYAGWYAIKIK